MSDCEIPVNSKCAIGVKSVAKAKVARHFSFVKKIIFIKKLRVFILTPPLPLLLLISVDLCDIRFGL